MPNDPLAEAGGRYHTAFTADDGTRFPVRPMREDDEPAIAEFLAYVDQDDIRLRFFHTVRTFDHKFLWPLVHYDHRQAVAFVAFDTDRHVIGVARLHCDIRRSFGEFAILVRSDLKRHGLGHFLMQMLIDWANDRAIPCVRGEVLRENAPMLALCRQLGFRVRSAHDDPGLMEVELAVDGTSGRSAKTPSTAPPENTVL